MRVIKFRAFDDIQKVMIYNSLEQFNLHKVFNNEIHYLIPLQFTGLKDKNGKEIYEGDIIRCYYRKHIDIPYGYDYHYTNYEIKYNKENARFEPYYYLDTKTWTTHKADILCGKIQIEVIGNIYENPELLKEDSKE